MKITYKETKKIIEEIIWKSFENRLWGSGAELTYYLVFAFFPFVMFLIGVVSMMQGEDGSIFQQIAMWLPVEIQGFLQEYSQYIYSMPGLLPVFLGGGMMLYSLTRAFHVLGFHMRRICGVSRRGGVWRSFRQSALFTITFMLLILVNFGWVVCGHFFVAFLDRFTAVPYSLVLLLKISRYILPMVLGFFFLLHLYRYFPGGKLGFRQALPGALFSLGTWCIVTMLFSFYMDRSTRYSLLYGSISAGIMLIVWLNLISILLLLGVQINVVLQHRKNPRNVK